MDPSMLNELEAEHREVEELLDQLATCDDADEQRTLTGTLDEMLTRHMEREEADVYPLLHGLDAELDEEARVEHDLVRGGLSRLEEMIGRPGFGAAVAMVQAGIAHHVEEEENEAFPMLRDALASGRLDGDAGGGTDGGNGGEDQIGRATRDELYEMARERGIEGRSKMTADELREAVRR